jgi:hypothetical protein
MFTPSSMIPPSELFPYISTLITVIVQKAVRLFTEP